MDNIEPNKLNNKVDLLKQIYKYADKGYKLNRCCLITDSIDELEFELAILQEKEKKTNLEMITRLIILQEKEIEKLITNNQ